MGLHQKITDRITSEPCNCGADDDHGLAAPVLEFSDGPTSEDDHLDYDWTDGTEASE